MKPCFESLSCLREFLYTKDHDHILTGNLQIAGNNKLRKILSKSPKYRQLKLINFVSEKDCIMKGIDECISPWRFNNRCNTQLLQEWKIKAIKIQNGKFIYSNIISLKNKSIATALENLHKNFIVAPFDKAYGDIAFICKRFSVQILLKELGLTTNNAYKTYTLVNNMSELDITNKHAKHIYNLTKTLLDMLTNNVLVTQTL